MWPAHSALIIAAGFAAGALNSVAGGGSFISFPALVFAGILPVNANATSTFALEPGSAAATWAYRRELRNRAEWKRFAPLLVVSVLGAIAGAKLLLETPQATFMRIVPWLLLAATLLFTFAEQIAAAFQRRRAHASSAGQVGFIALQLAVAVYIGYFGAGAGILMLALFALMGMQSIHTMNAFKAFIAVCANAVAVITFIVAGAIVWREAIVMTIGAAAGGYAGASVALKLPQTVVRYVVIVIGAGMTVYFFLRK